MRSTNRPACKGSRNFFDEISSECRQVNFFIDRLEKIVEVH